MLQQFEDVGLLLRMS